MLKSVILLKKMLKLKKIVCLWSCWGLRSPQTATMIASELKNSGHATEKHDLLNKSDYGNIRIYELRSVQFVMLPNEEGAPFDAVS